MTNQPKQEGANVTHCQGYYINGAHAGNIYYTIEGWGINIPEKEAEIKRQLDESISGLQLGINSSVSNNDFTSFVHHYELSGKHSVIVITHPDNDVSLFRREYGPVAIYPQPFTSEDIKEWERLTRATSL